VRGAGQVGAADQDARVRNLGVAARTTSPRSGCARRASQSATAISPARSSDSRTSAGAVVSR
jgi:hypothetical protein